MFFVAHVCVHRGATMQSSLELDPDAVPMAAVLKSVLFRMATEDWRSPDDRGDTVVHCVLSACSAGRLNEKVIAPSGS